jgi:arylformamidase
LAARLRDISISLHPGVPEWPGDTPFSCGWAASIADGSSVNVSVVTSSPHVGTHADAPLHVRDGWPGSHELPLEPFFGRCRVIDLSAATGEIQLHQLGQAQDSRIERLLLKTGKTVAGGTFPIHWPTLSEECARELLGRGLKLLGVDCPSVDLRESKNLPVHTMIFSGNACLLENLDLRRVPPGEYNLYAFPLKLMALDAAPVRAILEDLEQV